MLWLVWVFLHRCIVKWECLNVQLSYWSLCIKLFSRFLSVLGQWFEKYDWLPPLHRCYAVILCNVNFTLKNTELSRKSGRSHTVIHAGRGIVCCEDVMPSVWLIFGWLIINHSICLNKILFHSLLQSEKKLYF